ncbi:hypothetical protein NLI96_g611 [Meripilus lineatus]|uniref:Uncharacterized protein n=1 Tax=Meripilus lineatus TaxID=2056292 RepID=A0AAD5VHN9_9APHY|nr:hypothetical protein NLI96_g611 [Physisporinus lineatus]
MLSFVDSTLGTLFIGNTLYALLFGITTAQATTYFSRYSHDGTFHKVTIAMIWILDLLLLVIGSWLCYYYLISSFGTLDVAIFRFRFLGVTAVALTVGLSSPIPPPLRCSSGFVSGYSDSDRSDVGSAMVIFNFHDTDPNVKGVYLSDMEISGNLFLTSLAVLPSLVNYGIVAFYDSLQIEFLHHDRQRDRCVYPPVCISMFFIIRPWKASSGS